MVSIVPSESSGASILTDASPKSIESISSSSPSPLVMLLLSLIIYQVPLNYTPFKKTSCNYLPCNTLGWFPCIKSNFFFVIFCSILFLEYWLILCQIKIFYSNLFLILQSNYLLELLFHLLLLLRNICWVRLNRNWLSWFGRNQNL